jgi:2-oxoglutarate dehydrogenase complex dehydrogenase (E1) component-like enzyme
MVGAFNMCAYAHLPDPRSIGDITNSMSLRLPSHKCGFHLLFMMSFLLTRLSCRYHKIRTRQSVPQIYEQKLIVSDSATLILSGVSRVFLQNEGVLSEEKAAADRSAYKQHLEKELAKADGFQPEADMLSGKWSGLVWPGDISKVNRSPKTGVNAQTLVEIGKTSVAAPVGFVSPRSSSQLHDEITLG